MPWLVVLGRGSWRTGDRLFEAGAHEIDDEVAEKARQSRIKSLLVCDEEPVLQVDATTGLLTADDVRTRGRGGVRLARPETGEDALVSVELTYDFSCPQCPAAFPSRGALVRHTEFHHGAEAVS